MKKTYLTSICKYSLFISTALSLQFFSSCTFFGLFDNNETYELPKTTDYLKAESFVFSRQFEKALPYLDATLKKNDSDYENSLLLSARCYDQLGQPEKVILAMQELLGRRIDAVTELKSRSLLLKNLVKIKIDIENHSEKKALFNLTHNSSKDGLIVLESLNWALDFTCDRYCVEEITFLKEIQLQYVYIIEKDEISAERAVEAIKTRYEFFQGYLTKEHLGIGFRKKIASALLDSLKRLQGLQLSEPNEGSVRVSLLLQALAGVEKNVESWLYQ